MLDCSQNHSKCLKDNFLLRSIPDDHITSAFCVSLVKYATAKRHLLVGNEAYRNVSFHPPGQFRRPPSSCASFLSQRVFSVSQCHNTPSSNKTVTGVWSSRQAIRDQGLITEPPSWNRTIRWASQLTQAWMSVPGFWGRSLKQKRPHRLSQIWKGTAESCHYWKNRKMLTKKSILPALNHLISNRVSGLLTLAWDCTGSGLSCSDTVVGLRRGGRRSHACCHKFPGGLCQPSVDPVGIKQSSEWSEK